MSLTSVQQFQELFKKSSRPLILLPTYPTRDAVASAYALAFFLKKHGKDATVAGDNVLRDKTELAFLPEPEGLLSAIEGARDFVLSFNTERNKIIDVRTETVGQELRIYLTPEHNTIDPRDFSFIPAQFKFDLCLIVGAPDKESVGKIYENNADIFYEIPLINIDNHSQNELFGQVNFVDITASSVSEIATELIERAAPDAIDERIAECLLTGIISATKSFQKKNTTPKALQLASQLMDKGADQQKIVRSLYKTQPLNLLKLWGRVMAGVKWNEELKLIWAPVSLEDLVQSRSRVEDLPAVLERIKSNYSSATFFLLLYPESVSMVRGIVKAVSQENLTALAERFREGELQGDLFSFTVDARSLEEAELKTIEKWQQIFKTLPS